MKSVVVTGATSGIGFAVCRALMAGGYAVLGVGRSPEKCQKACEALREEFPGGQAAYFCGDLLRQRKLEPRFPTGSSGRRICTAGRVSATGSVRRTGLPDPPGALCADPRGAASGRNIWICELRRTAG